MKIEIEKLEKRLHQLEEAIRETEKRIPAHSVKPPVMEDLFALEDEKETIIKKITTEKEKQNRDKCHGG